MAHTKRNNIKIKRDIGRYTHFLANSKCYLIFYRFKNILRSYLINTFLNLNLSLSYFVMRFKIIYLFIVWQFKIIIQIFNNITAQRANFCKRRLNGELSSTLQVPTSHNLMEFCNKKKN